MSGEGDENAAAATREPALAPIFATAPTALAGAPRRAMSLDRRELLLGFLVGTLLTGTLWLALDRLAPWLSALRAGHAPQHANTLPATQAALVDPAFVSALRQPDVQQRDLELQALATRSDIRRAEKLLRALDNRTGPSADAARVLLLRRLTALDPELALAILADLTPRLGGRAPDYVATVYDAWARRDMDGALARLALQDDAAREPAADAVLQVVLERDGDVEALIARLPDSVSRTHLHALVAATIALRDPARAWHSAQQSGEREVLNAVAQTWAQSDGTAALAAVDALASAALREDLRQHVLTSWLGRDPHAAIDAALAEDRDGSLLPSLLFQLGSGEGAAAIDATLEQLPANARDAALVPLLSGIIAKDPATAWPMLQRPRITDDARAQLRTDALRRIAARDVAQAITLANSLDDSAERDALMHALADDYTASKPETALQFVMEIDNRALREQLREQLRAHLRGEATATLTASEPASAPAP